MVFFASLQSMFSLTLLVLVGYLVARRGWIAPETEIFVPRFIMNVVFPPFLTGNIVTHFPHDAVLHMLAGSLIPATSMLLTSTLAYLVALMLGVRQGRRAVFAITATTSNAMFIGIPVSMAFFGEAALPFVLLYFFANTFYFWALGSFLLSRESGSGGQRLTLWQTLAHIISPPLRGVLLGLALVILGIPVPGVILDTCRHLGNLAAPLALIYVGINLQRMDWKQAHFGLDVLCAVFARLALAPILMLGLLHIFPAPRLMSDVFVIQSALPTVANLPILAAFYRVDKGYASLLVSLTTLLGMLSVPLWRTILAHVTLGT